MNAADVREILTVQGILSERDPADSDNSELIADLIDWKCGVPTVEPASDFSGDIPAKASKTGKSADDEPAF